MQQLLKQWRWRFRNSFPRLLPSPENSQKFRLYCYSPRAKMPSTSDRTAVIAASTLTSASSSRASAGGMNALRLVFLRVLLFLGQAFRSLLSLSLLLFPQRGTIGYKNDRHDWHLKSARPTGSQASVGGQRL